jgi:uncharacterized alpha-E superfamily protein
MANRTQAKKIHRKQIKRNRRHNKIVDQMILEARKPETMHHSLRKR